MGFLASIFGTKENTAIKEAIQEGAYLVDVRTPGEFAAGTAKGAVNIPLDVLESQLSKFKGKKNIVLFCRSGARSGTAKRFLEEKGFENVYNGGTWQGVDRLVE